MKEGIPKLNHINAHFVQKITIEGNY
jgi:hypothetical protein